MTKIKRSTLGFVLFGLLFILSSCQLLESKNLKYEEASQFINSIADKLGRTKDNQISSRHLKSSFGALYSYDYIEITFSTDMGPAQLSPQWEHTDNTLKERGLVLDHSRLVGPNYEPIQSLQRSGLPLTLDHLSFSLGRGEILQKETLPSVFERIYNNSKWPSVFKIELMEPNAKGDKWVYQDKVLNGNVVILTLDLLDF